MNAAGNTQQARQIRERETLLQARIDDLRGQLVGGSDDDPRSLNAMLLEFELARLEVRLAEEALNSALLSAEATRRDADLSRYFFQVVVPPSPPTQPASPNVLRSGLLTLLVLIAAFSFIRLLLPRE